jgi:hypothetical protein
VDAFYERMCSAENHLLSQPNVIICQHCDIEIMPAEILKYGIVKSKLHQKYLISVTSKVSERQLHLH